MVYQIYRHDRDGHISLFDEVTCPLLALRVQNALVRDGSRVHIQKIPYHNSRLAQAR